MSMTTLTIGSGQICSAFKAFSQRIEIVLLVKYINNKFKLKNKVIYN